MASPILRCLWHPTHPTLAALLKKNGYHTAAFIGAVILDSKTLAPGLDRGFDFYDNFPAQSKTKSRWGRVERRGQEVVQHAEAWMTAHPAGPHFVWVHLYDPHDPYEPPPPYSQTYKDRLYDGEIAYADSVLAGFVGYLKKTGRYDNALIVVVGDHGEGLGEHHEDTHGIFLYDSTTHVPLIIKTPVKLPGGSNPGQVVEAQVRTTDILPTVMGLVRVPPPEVLDGVSLQPYLAGAERQRSHRHRRNRLSSALRLGAPAVGARRRIQVHRGAAAGVVRSARRSWRAGESLPAVGCDRTEISRGCWRRSRPVHPRQLRTLPDPKDKIDEQNLLHTAMMASDDNRTDEARQALEKVLQLDPKSPTALRQLGELEFHAGDYRPGR